MSTRMKVAQDACVVHAKCMTPENGYSGGYMTAGNTKSLWSDYLDNIIVGGRRTISLRTGPVHLSKRVLRAVSSDEADGLSSLHCFNVLVHLVPIPRDYVVPVNKMLHEGPSDGRESWYGRRG